MNDSSCPECSAPLPGNALQSLCPACLMRQALASHTVQGTDSAGMAATPTTEEIAGRFPQFEILECLGRGGMGIVYKARQKSLNRLVAIKILAPEREHDARFAERFAREAELLARLNHPHIVTIHDFGHADGWFYLVMEFVDGVNLRDLLGEGRLDPKQALAIVPPLCEALQYAHDKGIVHRDIKPENLLLDREGRIKVADFGIATLLGSSGESSGTPPYMAPEQACGLTDHRADLYALGVVLYEMLTGERPGTDLVPPSQKARTDARLDEMVLRALEKEPAHRYQSATEFRTVVETLQTPAPQETPPPLPAPGKPHGKLRRYWWVFLVTPPLGALLGLVIAVIWIYLAPKVYESNALVQITCQSPRTPEQPGNGEPLSSELTSSECLRAVIERLQLADFWMLEPDQAEEKLRDLIHVRNLPGTSLTEIRTRYTDPIQASEITRELIAVNDHRFRTAPPDGMEDLAIHIHQKGTVPSVPVAPNVPRLLVLFPLVGLLLSPLGALALMFLPRWVWLSGTAAIGIGGLAMTLGPIMAILAGLLLFSIAAGIYAVVKTLRSKKHVGIKIAVVAGLVLACFLLLLGGPMAVSLHYFRLHQDFARTKSIEAKALQRTTTEETLTEPEVTDREFSIHVNVLGEVDFPGSHRLETGGTLLDALAVAGGWTEEADLGKVVLQLDSEKKEYDLEKIARGLAADPVLRNHHQVIVPTTSP
ncbi:MAG: protein kinase [Akkermansiaceae bacterium]|jgi:serine/threonine protein kinase|nr:protein kinase [Akkermansiaceae bacterium]